MLEQPTGPARQDPPFDIKQTTETVCDKCQGESFQQAFLLRKVSALLSESGREGYMPIQLFACMSCGHINETIKPAELRSPVLTS